MKIRFYHCRQVYAQLPMQAKSILPDDGFAKRPVQIGELNGSVIVMDVWCKPKPGPNDSWGHRVLVICPCCHKDIPFGRMNQHHPVCFAKHQPRKN